MMTSQDRSSLGKLAAVVSMTAALAVLLAVAALTALPSWAHTRSPAGRVLSAEPA